MNIYEFLFWALLPPFLNALYRWYCNHRKLRDTRMELWASQKTLMQVARGTLTKRYHTARGGKVTFEEASEEMRKYCRYTPPEVVIEAAFGEFL